jgi:hypothetical protein
MAYDPIRGRIVAPISTPAVELIALDVNNPSQGWQVMATPAPAGVPLAIAFDPVGKRLVYVSSLMTYALDSAPVVPNIPSPTNQLVFEAACDCFAYVVQLKGPLLSSTRTTLVEVLEGAHWRVGISTNTPYFGSAWSARENVMLIPATTGSIVFEQRAGTTTEQLPSVYDFIGSLYDDPPSGGPVGIGNTQGFVSEYTIGYHGPGGDELCDGSDGDGDGLVDCADPDCWWRCTPACPPGTCP